MNLHSKQTYNMLAQTFILVAFNCLTSLLKSQHGTEITTPSTFLM